MEGFFIFVFDNFKANSATRGKKSERKTGYIYIYIIKNILPFFWFYTSLLYFLLFEMKGNIFFGFDFKDLELIKESLNNHNSIDGIDSFLNDCQPFKQKDETSVKKWIDEKLIDTKRTILLIGENTLNLAYIHYIINKSEEQGNELIGIRLYSNDDMTLLGRDAHIFIGEDKGKLVYFDTKYSVYDYKNEGYNSFSDCLKSLL